MQKRSIIILIAAVIVAVACGSVLIGYSLPKNSGADPADLSELFTSVDGPVHVVGHAGTDLDTVCSAVAVAELLQKAGIDAIPAVCSELCPEGAYVLDLFGKPRPVLLENASGKRIVMVDHNAFSQGANGLDQATVFGVFDHHNLQGLSLATPRFVVTEPVGATATIVYRLYDRYHIDLDRATANLLLVAILDDTLRLRSVTTTSLDEDAAFSLQSLTGTGIDELYRGIIAVETDYRNMTTVEIFHADEKPYLMGGRQVSISDIRVVGATEMADMLARMKTYLQETDPVSPQVHRYVIITDLDGFVSELIYGGNGEKAYAERAFAAGADGRITFDEAAIRKAMIVPPLTEVYTSS